MIPFSEHRTASLPAINNIHRLKIYRKFIGWDTVPEGVKVLDMGQSNFIASMMGIMENTGERNLNHPIYFSGYDVVTNFEVINHILNVQTFLEDCFLALDRGGKMYLATPKPFLITWYHGDNFAEYKREHLERVFKYVGFDVLRYEIHNPWPLRFIFYGIRPIFRYIFNRFQIWELGKR